MGLYDAVVVGSGLAGTFAAYAFRGRDVLVLDVGFRPPDTPSLSGNLYELRKRQRDLFAPLIGGQFESLHNIHKPTISLKLKAPLMSYIVRDAEQLSPLSATNFRGVMSFAQGGLANAWGAGVYRFSPGDLDEFPIRTEDLAPYYDELTKHIGVSGANDGLAEFFGHDPDLLPPLRLSRFATLVLQKYTSRKDKLNRQGVFVGYPRLAVLTQPHNGRPAYQYEHLEFFKPHNPAVYNPVFTLDELVARGQAKLKTGYLVTHYRDGERHVEVYAKNLCTGATETFEARSLFLAAGTLNTSKLVLMASGDYSSHLPILDNPMCCIPLFRARWIGAALDTTDSSLAQLNVLYRSPENGEISQAALYGATGPLRSDLLFEFPLPISASLTWARYLAPSMGLLMLFYPGRKTPQNYLKLDPSGLEVHCAPERRGLAEQHLIRAFRGMGFLTAPALCQRPPMGSSIHYAGTLPMRRNPGPYETGPDGLLFGTRRVYVVDGACFSALPSKNLSFTIMANALRIATEARRTLPV